MKNILLPTDFSECSWNAIVYALNFFEKSKCSFYLLHVSPLSNSNQGNAFNSIEQAAIEETYLNPVKIKLRQLLKRISLELPHNDKHNFYILADCTFFVQSIRKYVSEKKIDMIVMGTKGASVPQGEYVMGSHANDVITKVKCNSMVVPMEATFKHVKEVAFPTDFMLSYDINILNPISNLLTESNGSLRILHIMSKGKRLNVSQQTDKELLEDFFEDYKQSTHFLTNINVEDDIQYFVENKDIDVMVMVAKNLNYFQQILFHSRVEKVSYHTNIPFLILHE